MEENLKAFKDLFRGRTDVWGSVEGRSNKETVAENHYQQHLEGKRSLGIYPLFDDGTCCFAVIDVDEKVFDKALGVRNALKDCGISAYIAESKSKGYHVYVFAETMFVAKDIRWVLHSLLQKLKISAEIFPKQDKLDEVIKYGNYINLPYFGESRQFITVDNAKLGFEEAFPKIVRTTEAAVAVALKILPPEPPQLIPQQATKKGKKASSPPPCILGIMKGVNQGIRDAAAFALARHHLDHGYLPEEVLALLQVWDQKNKPPIGDIRVLQTKVQSAEKGYAFGCASITDDGLLSHLCPGEDKCTWLHEIKKERKKKGFLKEVSFYEDDTFFYEEIIQNKKPIFVSYNKATGELNFVPSIEVEGISLVPIYTSAVVEGAVKLPTGVEKFGTTRDLISLISEHINKYTDLNPSDLEFVTWYILMSWTFDMLPNVQYCRFLGDTGTGKSRSLDTVGDLCYKPMVMAGAVTPAPIYRMIDKFRGTLVLDEADFNDTSYKSEVITILNCLTPDTVVVAPRGAVSINTVKIGDMVLGHSGYFQATTKVFKRYYEGDLIRIMPGYSNISINISQEHPVLTDSGWVEPRVLTLKDRLAIPKPKIPDKDIELLTIPVKWPLREKGVMRAKGRWSTKSKSSICIPFNEDIAWLMGLYIAEGCSHSKDYIVFTLNKAETKIIQRVSEIFEKYFQYRPSISLQNESCHITVCIAGLGQQFVTWFGKKAPEKRIPPEMIILPKPKLIALVKGILDGDGHQQPEQEHIQLTTSSECLTWSLKLALARLDILAGVYFKGKGGSIIQGRRVKTHDRWEVRISAANVAKLGYPAKENHIQQIKQDNDFWYTRIEKLETIPYSGELFNLSVENDESYSLINLHCHNCGFERGRPIIRCSSDNPDELLTLPCFGPKVFATRSRFEDKALESRCMTIEMIETDREDIPPYLGSSYKKAAEKLRNQLLLYRLTHRHLIDPDSAEDIDLGQIEPRLKQTGIPYAIAFKDDPEVLDRYKTFLKKRHEELIEERADSVPGRVLYAFLKTALVGKKSVTTNAIQTLCQEELKLDLKANTIGRILGMLGIKKGSTKRIGAGVIRYYTWDVKVMTSVKKRYFPKEEAFESLFSGFDL